MDGSEPVEDDEVILRRIPPSTRDLASTTARPDGRLRATSVRLSRRDDEAGLSCSRLVLTSPTDLLNQLHEQEIDPAGWLVCRIFVKDVRDLGLDVMPKPMENDPGHCEIYAADFKPFPNKKAAKLAKKTRILMDEEVNRLKAGDKIEE